MKFFSLPFTSSPLAPDPAFDRKFAVRGTIAVLLLTIFFTYIHHFQPQIFRVPNNWDVSTWVYPTFDQTCLYPLLSPQEKAKIIAEGVPGKDNWGGQLFNDLLSMFFSLLCFWHIKKHYGSWMAWCFVLGSFVFTGLQESIWIIFGRFTGLAAVPGLGEPTHGSYWFTRGLLWFFETPVFACFSWLYIAYTGVWIATKVFRRNSVLGVASIGAFAAMVVDLWLDPIATAAENMTWVWAQQDVLRLYGIPISNFSGWFFVILVFAILWENLPHWEAAWGRAKATKVFIWALLAADVGVVLINGVFDWILRAGLIIAGFTSTVNIPAGW